MKSLARRFIVWQLGLLARAVLRRYQPTIVGITGSVGKTTTKELVAAALREKYALRAAPKNYNSEIGVPLTILNRQVPRSIGTWLRVFAGGWKLALRGHDYPELLVLEIAADRPGDIARLVSIAPPDVAVVTNVRPIHLINYENIEQIAVEKSQLVRGLKSGGTAVLNFDDTKTRIMRSFANENGIFFGATDEADVWFSDVVVTADGTRAVIHWHDRHGERQQEIVTPLLGRAQLYAVTAALAVALRLEVVADHALATICSVAPSAGHLTRLNGKQGSLILDDTYNASGMQESLAVLRELPGPRRAVLGGMAELGGQEAAAHAMIGEFVADWIDQLVVIGGTAALIADAAEGAGLPSEKIVRVSSPHAAAEAVDLAGGTILIKGSQTYYLERVVEALLADPTDASKLVQRLNDPAHRAAAKQRY